MNKKILHITGAMNIGGTETMLINLYRKVNSKIKFDFISYSDDKAYYDEEIKRLGGNIIRLRPPSEVGFFSAIRDIKDVINKYGPYDVVHTHMLFNCGIAIIAAYLSKVKVRVSHAHTTSDNTDSYIRRLYIYVMRFFIRVFSTDFLACSDAAAKYLFGNNVILNKKYKMVPNYIDYDKFIDCNDKESIRDEFGISYNDIVVCNIGRFVIAKNHEFIIEMANEMIKENSRVKFLLVGDGELKENIEFNAKKLGIEKNIYFTGIRSDIPNILNNSDLFILPSIYEGLGLVLLEAQAAGLPCLVSEAIQPEVDLGIGLIKKINLSKGATAWVNEAKKIIQDKSNKNIDVNKAVKEKKYDLNSILEILLGVYKLNLD